VYPRVLVFVFVFVFALVACASAWGAPANFCEAVPAIRAALNEAASVTVTNPTDFDRNIAPFLALRQRYPEDLFVHELYQDAVQQHGIEGHLSAATEEYQALWLNHSTDLMYRYLVARSLVGRGTASAIQSLSEIIKDHPDFAPAHRTLAEIYASEAFHNPVQEKAEREKFLALCPGSVLSQRPGPLPEPSPLADQSERLLTENGDLNRISEMAAQSARDDEWRLQRIRPFDWYSVEFKLQAQHDLQIKYFKVRAIQVRCDRKTGELEQASTLLAQMEQLAAGFRAFPGSTYWEALATLAHLYAEGNHPDQVAQKLGQMKQLLANNPDPAHAAQLKELQKQLARTKAAQ